MKCCCIIYFSLNQNRAEVFYNLTTKSLNKLKSLSLREGNEVIRNKSKLLTNVSVLPSPAFSSVYDFGSFLDSYRDKLSQLYIIIDYVSLCDVTKPACERNSAVVQDLIIRYPEVYFSFDEHLTKKYAPSVSFLDFIITEEKLKYDNLDVRPLIDQKMHSFDIDEPDAILSLCYFKDNLFDASNLRFAIKAQKYSYLAVAKRNFSLFQSSRAQNLALIVEEERSQNLFNSYAAFACGYRSLPVTTANGLKWANKHAKVQLIIRDYDLQFPDETGDNEIHKIRGWISRKNGVRCPWEYKLDANNSYWCNFITLVDPKQSSISKENVEHGIYYISKGVEGLEISMSSEFRISPDNEYKLSLPGIEKPISGIYEPLRPMFKYAFKKGGTLSLKKTQKDYIDTNRANGFHGVPLDVYYTVKSMIDRAQLYFDAKRYIHAAILARETMEVLNGFHESLLLQAYHILAVSENAIAMNAIGGSEEILRQDAQYRIKRIISEVEWLLRRDKEEKHERHEYKYNLLNQILSDCRKLCREKEHFAAEDIFISAMASVNEGFTACDIIKELSDIGRKIKDSWKKKKSELSEIEL